MFRHGMIYFSATFLDQEIMCHFLTTSGFACKILCLCANNSHASFSLYLPPFALKLGPTSLIPNSQTHITSSRTSLRRCSWVSLCDKGRTLPIKATNPPGNLVTLN